MAGVMYWALYLPSAVLRGMLHVLLAVLYCGRGKKVPSIKNPLLLKSATELAKEIREGKTKSEDVVRAYTDRILEVEPYLNATVDRPFLDALQEARRADALVASSNPEQLAREKPLLGVPFSVKVLLTVKGLKCTAGSLLYENVRAQEDSPTVALLRAAGGVVIATTNSAEFGMSFETNNKVHGKTCNPYDVNRTSGGSSGGESALIAAGGSVLGLGNDLVGSVRVPGHFTGIFAHKPTVGAVSNAGSHPAPHPGMQKMLYTGPMCRYAEDLVLSMRLLACKTEGPTLKIGQPVNFKKVKIYHVREIVTPCVTGVDKDITRGIGQAVEHFKSKFGCHTQEVKLPFMHDVNRCVVHHMLHPIIQADGDLKKFVLAGKDTSLNETSEVFKMLLGKNKLSWGPLLILNCAKTSYIYRESNDALYQRMLQKWMDEFDCMLDEDSVLLMPTFPVAAPYHNEITPLLPSCCYTSIFNITGMPSTQCPIGINGRGLPYGMQIVGRKNNDNLTIACAVELEKVFGGWREPADI